jgi:hypothetical protein
VRWSVHFCTSFVPKTQSAAPMRIDSVTEIVRRYLLTSLSIQSSLAPKITFVGCPRSRLLLSCMCPEWRTQSDFSEDNPITSQVIEC